MGHFQDKQVYNKYEEPNNFSLCTPNKINLLKLYIPKLSLGTRVTMRLTKTTQYAIRILSYIESRKTQYNATLLSKELDIPYKFLTKLMTILVKEKLILSIRGREGGYILAKEAKEIKIIDILSLFDDKVSDNECVLGIGICDKNNHCALHNQWLKPKMLIDDMFYNTSLQSLIKEGDKI